MHKIITLLLIFFSAILLQSKAPLQDAPDGALLFKKNCKLCHGKDAAKETKKIPSLLKSTLDLEAMTQIVKQGKETMPAFEETLNEAEIVAVLAYVQKLQAATENE
ncbi:MAG: cytochrome c [Bacteroidota bacterium]